MVTWEECQLLTQGKHKDFDLIYNKANGTGAVNEVLQGDLFLREIDAFKKLFHAGIYTGNNEVIEFTASNEKTTSVSNQEGNVCKVGANSFLKKNGSILRSKTGIPEDFNERVEKAMESKERYNVLTNNCLHFALRLIGLKADPFKESLCTC